MVNFLPKIFNQAREPNEVRFTPLNVAQAATRDLYNTPASSIIHACVERIISRAVAATFYEVPSNMKSRASIPHLQMSPYLWYRQLYEQLLLTGNALVWIDENKNFNVGLTEGSSYNDETMVWNIVVDHNGHTIEAKHMEGMIHFYLGRKEGMTPHLVQSPVDIAMAALDLHDETRGLLCDYAKNGHRLAGTFMTTAEVTSNSQLKTMSHDLHNMNEYLDQRYSTMTTPPYMQYQPTGGAPPPSEAGIDLAVREIARVYGVPVELLQLGHYRSDFTNVDTHLLIEAVYPLLDTVAATWSEFFLPYNVEAVKYEPLSLVRVTLGSSAALIMQLSQTGVFTINELRRFIGLKEFPEYDVMPQSAGAPGREGEGGNGSPSKESGHPGGGSEETDDRNNSAADVLFGSAGTTGAGL